MDDEFVIWISVTKETRCRMEVCNIAAACEILPKR